MALIDAAIIDVNNLLLQHNYQPMPFGHYKYFNQTAHKLIPHVNIKSVSLGLRQVAHRSTTIKPTH